MPSSQVCLVLVLLTCQVAAGCQNAATSCAGLGRARALLPGLSRSGARALQSCCLAASRHLSWPHWGIWRLAECTSLRSQPCPLAAAGVTACLDRCLAAPTQPSSTSVRHIAGTLRHASALQVLAEPLLRPHADYYSGVLIQVHLVQPDTGACALLAVGTAQPSPVPRSLCNPVLLSRPFWAGQLACSETLLRTICLLSAQRATFTPAVCLCLHAQQHQHLHLHALISKLIAELWLQVGATMPC